jgi:hypothetical protein
MNTTQRYHTSLLIVSGYLLVILPTIVLLFIPLGYVILPGVVEALKYPLRLFGAMAVGLLLAFIYYRIIAPRWVEWAVAHAADLPALKRKMRANRLLPEGLLVSMSRSRWLSEELRQQLQSADHRKAMQDNPAVPEQLQLYQIAYYRLLGWIAIFLFAASAAILMGLMPSGEWWQITGFAPLLIGGLVLLPRRNSKLCLLTLTTAGITYKDQYWAWHELGDMQYEVRHSWHGSPAHSNYVVNTRKLLKMELLTGDNVVLDLSKALIKIDLEEYIAVYRYRHSLQHS